MTDFTALTKLNEWKACGGVYVFMRVRLDCMQSGGPHRLIPRSVGRSILVLESRA